MRVRDHRLLAGRHVPVGVPLSVVDARVRHAHQQGVVVGPGPVAEREGPSLATGQGHAAGAAVARLPKRSPETREPVLVDGEEALTRFDVADGQIAIVRHLFTAHN